MATSALLSQIQAGKKLKRVVEINDRSAPQVDTPCRSKGAPSSNAPSTLSGGGPASIAGLFAGGMPKLKPAGQRNFAIPPTIRKPSSASNVSSAPSNVLPSTTPVSARFRLPSQANDTSGVAPLPPRQAPPAIRSENPITPALPMSRSTPAVPNPSFSHNKARAALLDRAPPPPPKSSHEVLTSRKNSFSPPNRPPMNGGNLKPPVPRRQIPCPPPGFQ